MNTQIRSAVRKLWWFHPVQKEVKTRDRIEKSAVKADGTIGKAKRIFFLCAICGNEFPAKDREVDHIVPVGPTPGSKHAPPGTTWDDFFKRMFCPVSGLRSLCQACHKAKTDADTKARWEFYNNAG